MKITVLAENLKKGLSIVLRGVTNKGSLPILSGVLMKVNSEGLELLSTDLEISFRVKIGVKVKEEGDLVVPAKLLFDLVSSLPVGPVDLEVERQILRISGGGVKTEVVGQSVEEFPSLPKSKGKFLKINVEEFRSRIDRVAISAARDDTQPVLSGVLWAFSKDKIQLVATDRYRLGVDLMDGLKLDDKIAKKKLKPYRPKQSKFIIPLGGKYALADLGFIKFSGFFAWLLKHLVTLHYLISILPFGFALALWLRGLKIYIKND